VTTLDVDDGLIEAIAARLDLRAPNKEALESIAYCVSQHYDVDVKGPPFEGVVDAATGVGKTFIIAAAVEYYAARGNRNFAVIAPGRTILEKTIDNFTPGHSKSLLPGMEVEPLVVTTETFAQMDHAEDERARLYVFTVQSLTKPSAKQGKKTHEFHESLGEAFYARLQGLDDLIVFADEHHLLATLGRDPRPRAVRSSPPATPRRLHQSSHLPPSACGGHRGPAREDARPRRAEGRPLGRGRSSATACACSRSSARRSSATRRRPGNRR
jgi:hypothetical protein